MAQKNRENTGPALMNIYLTGFMCAGKTLAGKALARVLGRPFCDSDILLEKEAGAAACALIKTKGLGGFRRLETALVKKLASRGGRVIALGGGIYPSRRWESLLKKTGITVFLYCPWPKLKGRLKAARPARPLLAGPWEKAAPRAKKLYAARLRFYRRADITIETGGFTPAKAAEKIKIALKKNAIAQRREDTKE